MIDLRCGKSRDHLVRTLEADGESKAADLLRQVGGLGDAARDLSYRLYAICERRGWAVDGLAYNALVVAWPELSRLSSRPVANTQERLDV